MKLGMSRLKPKPPTKKGKVMKKFMIVCASIIGLAAVIATSVAIGFGLGEDAARVKARAALTDNRRADAKQIERQARYDAIAEWNSAMAAIETARPELDTMQCRALAWKSLTRFQAERVRQFQPHIDWKEVEKTYFQLRAKTREVASGLVEAKKAWATAFCAVQGARPDLNGIEVNALALRSLSEADRKILLAENDTTNATFYMKVEIPAMPGYEVIERLPPPIEEDATAWWDRLSAAEKQQWKFGSAKERRPQAEPKVGPSGGPMK